jgi:hypothetical protein
MARSSLIWSFALASLAVAGSADAATGTCDISGGEYTQWTGTNAQLDDPSTPTSLTGFTEARCLRRIRTLGTVVEDVFKDAKGRYANELPSYGKLVNMFPGENGNTICNGFYPKGKRNNPGVECVSGWNKTFAQISEYANGLDWKYVNPVRYDPKERVECPRTFPPMGCFGDRCYDADCVQPNGTLKSCPSGQICKAGACVAGAASSLPACRTIDPQGKGISDGDDRFYLPWNGLVFDLGGLANKVAIFAVNDHGPQPCESNEYTVYLTNDPAARDMVDDPVKTGADPQKWNRARLYKLYTHGWIDRGDCCDLPRGCDPVACNLPKPGDNPVLEADSMALVFTLPCGIAFRYAAFIAGYDGKGLDDPSKGADVCAFHSFDAEIDAVAGLNDDESAICPDKDGDGFPSCDCTPQPTPCDCVDDPAKDPDAKKYYPGAPQSCDGPQYSCAPTPCPTGTVCHDKQCLSPCASGEFKCPAGQRCETVTPDGGAAVAVCVPAPCGDRVCEPGETCKDGQCVDLCAPPVKCPVGQVCQGGKCIDPCALSKCPAGQSCLAGKCVDNCACLAKTAQDYPCAGETPVCDAKKGTCVPPGCDGLSCADGQNCVATASGPACKGKCDDVVCPGGLTCDPAKGCVDKCDLLATPCPSDKACKDGACVDPECVNVTCDAPLVCEKGSCVDQGSEVCLGCGQEGGLGVDAGDGGVDEGDPAFGEPEQGCGCTTPGRGPTGAAVAFGLFVAAGVLLSRRRR